MADNFAHRVVATLQSIRAQIDGHEDNTTDAHGINLYAKIASPIFTGTVETDSLTITGVADFTSATITGLDLLPSQTGNSGKYLTTNGTTTSWATVEALPLQTGNSGKYLTTNGTVASWNTIPQTSYTADAPASPTLGQLWVESDVDSTTISAGSIIQYQSIAPTSPTTGSMWFDSVTNTLKVYQTSTWNPVGAQNNGYAYVYNTNGINENWTIPSGYNAMSAGPITIANGVTVTIPNGSSWAVV